MAKIYWAIHGYPPLQNAGAEWMAKEINDYLTVKGDNVIYVHSPGAAMREEIMRFEPDIIITHLDLSAQATRLAEDLKLHCINIIHHTFVIPHLQNNLNPWVHLVYNAQWVADLCKYNAPSMVLHPPVNPDRFKDISGNSDGYITLVNCNKDKGALIFQEIARSMPHNKFLAVKGNHGPQIPLRAVNLKQVEATDDIREILAQTSLLLVPSIYESYGRIALEALACGIPVIATATPGLREALQGMNATLIHNRSFIPSWLQNINSIQKNDTPIMQQLRKDTVRLKWENSLRQLEQFNNLINSLV